MDSEKPKPEYKYIKKWLKPDNYMGEQFFENYVIYSHNRDSDVMNKSNWDTLIKLLDDNSFEYEIINCNHWACGWIEFLMIHESQIEALNFCEEKMKSIAEDYPLLDDMDFSDKETDLINESWGDWIESDFRNGLESKFEIELDTDKDIKTLFNQFSDDLNEYPIVESNLVYVNVEKIVEAIEIDDILPYLTIESLETLKTTCKKCSETFDKLHTNGLCDNCWLPNNDKGLNKTLDKF